MSYEEHPSDCKTCHSEEALGAEHELIKQSRDDCDRCSSSAPCEGHNNLEVAHRKGQNISILNGSSFGLMKFTCPSCHRDDHKRSVDNPDAYPLEIHRAISPTCLECNPGGLRRNTNTPAPKRLRFRNTWGGLE